LELSIPFFADGCLGNFVKALVDVEPGKNLLGAANVMTWKEWADLWGKTLGVTCKYEQLPSEEYMQAMPGDIGKELTAMWEYFSDFGYDGRDPSVVLPKDVGVPSPYCRGMSGADG